MYLLLKIMIIFCISAGFVITEVNASQELKISGKVMDLSDSPVSGAEVKIKKAGKSTVTDKNGNFSIPGITGTLTSWGRGAEKLHFTALRKGNLEIYAMKRTRVSITGFNLRGETVYRKKSVVDAGVHTFPVSSGSHGVSLFRINTDKQTMCLKVYSMGGTVYGKVPAEDVPVTSGISANQAAAAQQFVDTIFVTKTGYLEYALRIDKTDISGLNIRIAKEDLPVISQQHIFDPMNKPFRSCHAPSVLELPDGTLLAVFFAGTHEGSSDQKIYLCRKEPGKEWTKPAAVANGGGNPSLFRSTSGKVILFDGWGGRMQTSMDEGKTWSNRRKVCGGCSGPEKNKAVQLEDGTILTPALHVSLEMSKDDGETWTRVAKIGGGLQPTIMFHGNSRLQMMFRTEGNSSIGTTWSEDNGKTWSKYGGSILPNNSSGIDAVTLRDGRQVLAYNHSHRNEMGHKGRGILNLATSKDGKAWDAVVLVNFYLKSSYQYSYPGIIQSRNGLVHLVYTWHRRSIEHAVINPKAFKPVPMPDGKWPSSGPLSIEEWKKQNPGWDNINAPDLPK